MSLRIAHISATFPPYRAGTGNVCFHNARELAQRGHQVTVLTAAVADAPAHEVRDGFTVRRLTPLVRVGNAPVLPGMIGALRQFDLLHLHYPFIVGAEQVALAARLYGIPWVITFHNDLVGDWKRDPIFKAYQRISAHVAVRQATLLCSVSLDHFQHSRLYHMLGRHAPVVVELSNGVDVEHFAPGESTVRATHGIPATAKLLLFVAALDRAHHFKGFEYLLAACAQLPDDVWLLVVGDGDLRATYAAEARRMGLNKRVIFAGSVDPLPPYYRAADLTVLPSTALESFGLVLVESLACATPAVASNLPGVRTVIAHGTDGLLVPPGDPSALAFALAELLADAPRRHAMGHAGREKVIAKYAWPALAERLERIYYSAQHLQIVPTGS